MIFHSGTITGVSWKNLDEADTKFSINTYVRVLGLPRESKGEQTVMIVKIFPISELNEIPNHLLEVTYIMLKARNMKDGGNTSGGAQVAAGGGGASTSNFGKPDATNGSNESAVNGLDAEHAAIFNIIRSKNDDESGIERSAIKQLAPERLTLKIDHILDFLSNEGHIYTTCSDDYFKTT